MSETGSTGVAERSLVDQSDFSALGNGFIGSAHAAETGTDHQEITVYDFVVGLFHGDSLGDHFRILLSLSCGGLRCGSLSSSGFVGLGTSGQTGSSQTYGTG